VVVEAGRPFGGSLSEAFTADCVAVLLCCTTPGMAVSSGGRYRLPRSGPPPLPAPALGRDND
jgi:hypothetical protein